MVFEYWIENLSGFDDGFMIVKVILSGILSKSSHLLGLAEKYAPPLGGLEMFLDSLTGPATQSIATSSANGLSYHCGGVRGCLFAARGVEDSEMDELV